MSTEDRSWLDRAYDEEARALGVAGDEEKESEAVLAGQTVTVEAPSTASGFRDGSWYGSNEKGVPRPQEAWAAKQLGGTPQMQLIKSTITQQLTGGEVRYELPEDPPPGVEDLAAVMEDVYRGPHFQEKSWDDLITDTVHDLVDVGWAYWEPLATVDGEFPVAKFKPVPALQVQHNIDDETDELDEPAFYQAPWGVEDGAITNIGEPEPLERDELVVFRGPGTSRSDLLYGESLAMTVREWLEIFSDVDTHQKRFYADDQVPPGIIQFLGATEEDLSELEEDITEISGDPHEVLTIGGDDDAKWIPIGDSVVDLDALKQQKWYFKLILAAAGLNTGEIGVVEGAGFAKELPTQVAQVFKKVTKPYQNAVEDPQNNQVNKTVARETGVDFTPASFCLERFDPLHEQVERDQATALWDKKATTLNEVREATGKEPIEASMEIDGEEVDLANTPRYIVDNVLQKDRPVLDVAGVGGEGA